MLSKNFRRLSTKIIFFHNKPLLFYNFSQEIKEQPSKIEKAEIESLIEKSYDPPKFIKINDEKFVAKILKEEEDEIRSKNYRYSLKTMKYPLFLIFLTGFFFHCWFSVPYKVVYKHVTINPEYSIKPSYSYSWLFAPLSIRNTQDFLLYYPLMAFSLLHLDKFLRPKHFISFFLLNGLSCGLSAFLYEKYYTQNEKFKGKCLGGSTAIGFSCVLFAMKPGFRILNFRFLPFEVLLVGMLYYETLAERKNEKEISRIAIILAILNGLAFGRYFKNLAF